MLSGLEWIYILIVLIAVVFLWVLFRSDLRPDSQKSVTAEESFRPPQQQREIPIRARTQAWDTRQPLYSDVFGRPNSDHRRVSSHRKRTDLEPEFDGGRRRQRIDDQQQPFFVSRDASTPLDRKFLAQLNTRNNLKPGRVFVVQDLVPALDLHMATTKEAWELVHYFLENNRRQRVRIITGIGRHSEGRQSTLKQIVQQILTNMSLNFVETARGGAFEIRNG